MGKIYLLGLVGIMCVLQATTVVKAQEDFVWAEAEGGSYLDGGYDVALDAAGNSYVTGYFTGTDVPFGNTTLSSNGDEDIFVAKYDETGNVQWVVSAGGSGSDFGRGITIDATGNVIITGQFFNTADFGSTTITADSFTFDGIDYFPSTDIFVAKYDNQGNFIWAESTGGTGADVGNGVDVDALGNSFITGYIENFNTFDNNYFISKYDPLGNQIWFTVNGSATNNEESRSIATDALGNSYITGTFNTPDFTTDIFVAMYNPLGGQVWYRVAGGDFNDGGMGIDIDAQGSAYITGYISGNTMFGGLTANGNIDDPAWPESDIFVAKYSITGTPAWVKTAGGMSRDQGYAIAVDADGNSYLTGFYIGEADFGSIILTSTSNSGNSTQDIFLASYDSTGTLEFAESAGGTDLDEGLGIGATNTGIAVITGFFSQPSATFGGAGTISSNGSTDIFTALYGDIGPLPVHLISYTATKQNNSALLQWQTATEENNAGFVIEVSTNGKDFKKLASVAAINGPSSYGARYSYTDSDIFSDGTRYYRLTQYDLDGTRTDLGIRAVNFTSQPATSLMVGPNPFRNQIKVTIETALQQKALVKITDGLGRVITSKTTQLNQGTNQILLPETRSLKTGMYVLSVQLQTEVISCKIIKQ